MLDQRKIVECGKGALSLLEVNLPFDEAVVATHVSKLAHKTDD